MADQFIRVGHRYEIALVQTDPGHVSDVPGREPPRVVEPNSGDTAACCYNHSFGRCDRRRVQRLGPCQQGSDLHPYETEGGALRGAISTAMVPPPIADPLLMTRDSFWHSMISLVGYSRGRQ